MFERKYTGKPCPAIVASVNMSTTLTAILCDDDTADRWEAYRKAGFGPEDLDLFELHDAFTHRKRLLYRSVGLADRAGREDG
jgi:acetyl-CoA acetyltransferase